MGQVGAILGQLGSHAEASWLNLVPSWDQLSPIWTLLGSTWALFGRQGLMPYLFRRAVRIVLQRFDNQVDKLTLHPSDALLVGLVLVGSKSAKNLVSPLIKAL